MSTFVFTITWRGTYNVVLSPLGPALYWDLLAACGDVKSWENKNHALRGQFEVRSAIIDQKAGLHFLDRPPVETWKHVGLERMGPLGSVEPVHSIMM